MKVDDYNLYKVDSAGLGSHYVLAPNPDRAYQILLKEWDDSNYGFSSDRKLKCVHLIAESGRFYNGEPRVRVC